jgi:sortase A
MRKRFANRRRPLAFYSLGVIALLAISVSILLAGTDLLSGAGEEPARKASASTADREIPRSTVDGSAIVEWAAREEGLAARKKAEELAAKKAAAKEEAKEKAAEQRSDEGTPQAAVPSDTTMYLTIPKMGLYDIPVLEGTSEAVLSQGVGHLPGTGFPWIEGSNTYIAGHRLGYPGTVSDHVFWGLPNLAVGDQVFLEDSLGQTYTYQVSEILEVPPSDLSVTASTGTDGVSLQTCIENYGDYWTPGPNWLARFIVRAERVG